MTMHTHDIQHQMETRAEGLLNAMVNGKYRNAVAHFDSTMTSLLPADKVEELWTAIQEKAGPFVEQISAHTVTEGELPIVVLTCKFAQENADLYVTFNETADIAGLHVGPAPDEQAEEETRPEAEVAAAAAPE